MEQLENFITETEKKKVTITGSNQRKIKYKFSDFFCCCWSRLFVYIGIFWMFFLYLC